MSNSTTQASSTWLAPTGLILLSLLPIVGGAARLTQLTAGAKITPQNQRFFDTPVPVYIHIVTVTIYVLLGAFQFVPALRVHAWHRRAGRISAVSGLLAALSGLWLAVTYFLAEDGPILLVVRLVIGVSMVISIALGVSVIVQSQDIVRHGAWMTRAYAIGAAAGTEAAISIAPELLAGPSEGARQIGVTIAAWVINLAVAEWVIRWRESPRDLQRKPALWQDPSVLDKLRHKLAVHYLSGEKTSVTETAYLVGSSEPAAFSRAFKRWTGTTPRSLLAVSGKARRT